MQDIAFWSAKRLASHVRRRKIGCLELLDHYLARVKRYNLALNAIIVTDIPAARKRAQAADRALKKGDVWGPLHGLPMTVKESYDVAGLPTTWGLTELKDNIAKENAVVIDRLLGAGAVLFGKTNVPRLLADWQSFNDIYGTTNNPWDVTRSPGGSSGGAAAALAAGLTGLESGSDIGGSIRNPAHFCGVYGHKPTYGLVPIRGHAQPGVVAAADISVVGPLGRSADDLALALGVIAGPDEPESAGYRLALAPPKKKRWRDFKVAVLLEHPIAAVERGLQDELQKLVDFLGKKNVQIVEGALPAVDVDKAWRLFIGILNAAMSGRLSPEAFAQTAAAARELAPDDQSPIALALRDSVMTHKDWLVLNNQRHHMRRAWAAFFQDYDFLLCPAAGLPAPAHDQSGLLWQRQITINGEAHKTADQLFWAGLFGAFYLPGTVAPVGFVDGLPVGVQIVGPQFGDLSTIAFARMLEREYHGFVAPKGYA
jgi:amidase